MTLKHYLQKPIVIIIIIWLFLTAININKAFQMDDAFHLEAAQNIIKNPLKPMSGYIRWDEEPEPMYNGNQPPLLFYMIAGVSLLFGFNEIALHLLISIFTFLALFWFYKTACLSDTKKPLFLLALFGLCPAFIVNQNVLTDIPILSLIMGTTYYFLLADKTKNNQYNILAMVLISIAVFIKYTVLPVIAAIALIFILKKEYKKILLLLIPFTLILLWSAWNYWDFGNVHILMRKIGSKSTIDERAWTFVACLGSVAPFGAIFLAYLFKKQLTTFIVFITTAIFVLVAFFYYLGPSTNEDQLTKYLEISFFINGAIIIISTIIIVYKNLVKPGTHQAFLNSDKIVLVLFLAAVSSFLILFAPFMGTRHLLLTIPFFLLLAEPVIKNCSKILLRFSLIASIILSLLLGISDWKYAFYYKDAASAIMKAIPPGNKVWATGTGGWQWYAKQNGMIQHSLQTAKVKVGDFIVLASGLPAFRINSDFKFELLAKIWGEVTPLSYFSVSNGGSLYNTAFGKPSWKLSKKPVDTIYVCRYTAPK